MLRILADENVEVHLIRALRDAGYDVLSVLESKRGIADEQVLNLARIEHRLLLTMDKDFGDLIFRQQLVNPQGVFLCRVAELPTAESTQLILHTLSKHLTDLPGNFGVLTGRFFRLRQMPEAD